MQLVKSIYLSSPVSEPYTKITMTNRAYRTESDPNLFPVCVPTPSASLNNALRYLCEVSYMTDLTDAALLEVAKVACDDFRPVTTGSNNRVISPTDLLSWFDDLSGDEFFSLAGIELVTARSITD